MRGLKDFLDAVFPGVPPGAIFSTIAQLHTGSHDAALETVDLRPDEAR